MASTGARSTFSLDDAFSPPKTVEQTRKLVEGEGVLAMFGSSGTDEVKTAKSGGGFGPKKICPGVQLPGQEKKKGTN